MFHKKWVASRNLLQTIADCVPTLCIDVIHVIAAYWKSPIAIRTEMDFTSAFILIFVSRLDSIEYNCIRHSSRPKCFPDKSILYEDVRNIVFTCQTDDIFYYGHARSRDDQHYHWYITDAFDLMLCRFDVLLLSDFFATQHQLEQQELFPL